MKNSNIEELNFSGLMMDKRILFENKGEMNVFVKNNKLIKFL